MNYKKFLNQNILSYIIINHLIDGEEFLHIQNAIKLAKCCTHLYEHIIGNKNFVNSKGKSKGSMSEEIWLQIFQREFARSPSQYNDMPVFSGINKNYEAVKHGFKTYKQMRCLIQYKILPNHGFFINNLRMIKDRDFVSQDVELPLELECLMKNLTESDDDKYISDCKFPLNLLKMSFYKTNYQSVAEKFKYITPSNFHRFILLNQEGGVFVFYDKKTNYVFQTMPNGHQMMGMNPFRNDTRKLQILSRKGAKHFLDKVAKMIEDQCNLFDFDLPFESKYEKYMNCYLSENNGSTFLHPSKHFGLRFINKGLYLNDCQFDSLNSTRLKYNDHLIFRFGFDLIKIAQNIDIYFISDKSFFIIEGTEYPFMFWDPKHFCESRPTILSNSFSQKDHLDVGVQLQFRVQGEWIKIQKEKVFGVYKPDLVENELYFNQ